MKFECFAGVADRNGGFTRAGTEATPPCRQRGPLNFIASSFLWVKSARRKIPQTRWLEDIYVLSSRRSGEVFLFLAVVSARI